MCLSNRGGSEPFPMLGIPKCRPGSVSKGLLLFVEPLGWEEVSVSAAEGRASRGDHEQ